MSETRFGTSSRGVYTLLVVLVAAILGAMGYALYAGTRMSFLHEPLVGAAMGIELEATTAHLWFEEILSGDRHESMDDVWRSLDRADWYAAAMLEGGEDDDGTIVALTDPGMRAQIERVRVKLAEFRGITEERWRARAASVSGSEIDQRFDQVFRDFLEVAEDVRRRLNQEIVRSARLLRRIQIALITGVLGLSLLVGLVLARHIGERRRAEESLKQSEEQLRLVFGRAPIAIAVVDEHGRFLRVNPALCTMLDQTEGELVGRGLPDVTHPEDVASTRERLRALFGSEIPQIQQPCRYLRRSGEPRFGLLHGSLIPGARGRPTAAVVEIIDQTERVKAEEEAQQHRERLAHVTRLSTMGEMAAGIAHEINQPLSAIATTAQACRRLVRQGRAGSAEQLEALELIDVQARRAGEVIRRLRNFIAKRGTQRELVDINDLSREVVKLTVGDAQVRGFGIRLELADRLPSVVADRVQIQQVLLNLIRNGLEAMEESGRAEGVVVRTACGSGEEVEVAVVDRGVGISEEVGPKLFTPFLTTKKSGMGIGLAISQSIVTAHGGRLWFRRNPEGGTTFLFTLPTAVGAVHGRA